MHLLRTSPDRRQCGVIFLALVLVLFVTGSTLTLGVLNNHRYTAVAAQHAEKVRQLELAKLNLLAYAANSAVLNDHTIGAGFFPCPDTDAPSAGTPEPNAPCRSNNDASVPLIGRLPEYVIRNNGERFPLNDYYAGTDQQFWYVVGPRYVYESPTLQSTSSNRRSRTRTSITTTLATSFRLYLDGEPEYVAFIIAPGDELETQDRAGGPTNYANYLDGLNGSSGFNYYTSYSSNPDAFNDVVIGITLDEWMRSVGYNVVVEMVDRMDEFLETDADSDTILDYPASSASSAQFRDVFDSDYLWLRYDSSGGFVGNYEFWSRDTTWVRDPNATSDRTYGTLRFSGCTGMTFWVDWVDADTTTITLAGDSC